MVRHRRKRFPINAFFINAQPAPILFILEDLMGELIDAGTGFAGAGVAGDKPAPAKLIASPRQIAEFRDIFFRFMRSKQMPEGQRTAIKCRSLP